ncbi:MAG: hydrogenase formation protein HypD [Deltaproteobacteria bacterium]|nr:hydrogenase formation protein HypD [Deltaproteobacteria bacterium]
MKYVSEFRDKTFIAPLVDELRRTIDRPLRVMEVCGTHTMAIFRHGLRAILPEGLNLISGPGCPVCVTSAAHIDGFIEVAGRQGVRAAIFGDLFRVPGTHGSLARAQSAGAHVEVVYSPTDALALARNHPEEIVVFLSVGFETTIPLVAATILEAQRQEVDNFAVFSAHKIMPPALAALLGDPELRLDGLLCPGHVSTIIGAAAYEPLAAGHGLSCVVAGFEPVDILQALIMVARQAREGRFEVENAYGRAVTWEGNPRARKLMDQVFEPVDCQWRGLGIIPGSGMAIRPEFARFDAEKRFGIRLADTPEPKGCMCGEILKGRKTPADCPLFAGRCTPLDPVGPCMVSSEGTCAAHYRFGQTG